MVKEWTGGLMLATALLTLAASAAQAANWPTFMYSNAHTGFNKSETTLNTGNVGTMTNIWNVSVGDSAGFSSDVDAFSVTKDLLFGPGADFGSVVALNTSDGSVKWQTDIVPLPPTNSISLTPPAIASGVVYAYADYAFQINGVSGALYAFSAKTGNVMWATADPCNVSVTSPPIVADGMVFFGDVNGAVTALNASNGAVVWTQTCISGGPTISGSPGFMANKTLGNVVYVTEQDYPHGLGSVIAYNAATGAVLWNTGMGPIAGAPAIGGGKVYVNSGDGNLYALNDTMGTVVWKFAPSGGDPGYASPAYANGIVYTTDESSNLYALNAKKGTVVWEDASAVASDKEPVVANGVVYAPLGGDGLSAFDASSGNLLFSKLIGCFAWNGQPVVVDGAVYQVGVSGCGGQDLLAKWGLP